MSVFNNLNVNETAMFSNFGNVEEFHYYEIPTDNYTKNSTYPELINGEPQWIEYDTVFSVFISVTPGQILSIQAKDDYKAKIIFTGNNDFTEPCIYISDTNIPKSTKQTFVVPVGAHYAFFYRIP